MIPVMVRRKRTTKKNNRNTDNRQYEEIWEGHEAEQENGKTKKKPNKKNKE